MQDSVVEIDNHIVLIYYRRTREMRVWITHRELKWEIPVQISDKGDQDVTRRPNFEEPR